MHINECGINSDRPTISKDSRISGVTVEFFTNSQLYKNDNIANLILAVTLERNCTSEVCNLKILSHFIENFLHLWKTHVIILRAAVKTALIVDPNDATLQQLTQTIYIIDWETEVNDSDWFWH